jgi:hypothetical protein
MSIKPLSALRLGAAALAITSLMLFSPQEAALAQARAADGVVSDDVPAILLDRIQKIAAAGEPKLHATAGTRVVFVGAEPLREKPEHAQPGAETRGPLYLATYYRYADDVTVYVTVDIEKNTLVRTQAVRHTPTRITDGELKEAAALARADKGVRAAVGGVADMDAEALALYAHDPKDPLYGHRTLNLFFHRGQRYVANVDVIVDLTTRRVSVIKRSAGNGMEH